MACYYSPAQENKNIARVLHCWQSLSHIHNISNQSKTTNSWTLPILVSTWTWKYHESWHNSHWKNVASNLAFSNGFLEGTKRACLENNLLHLAKTNYCSRVSHYALVIFNFLKKNVRETAAAWPELDSLEFRLDLSPHLYLISHWTLY
jgi:hypothetical protein